MNKWIASTLIFLIHVATHAVVVDRVAAIVGKEPILLSEIDNAGGLSLEKLIAAKLISIDLHKSGQDVTDAEIEEAVKNIRRQHNLTPEQFKQALSQQGVSVENYHKQLKEQIQHMKLIQGKIKSQIQISDDDIQSAYNKKYGSSHAASKRHLKHVLFKGLNPTSKKNAEKLLAEIQSGKKKAKNVIREDFGIVSRGELLPNIEEIVFALGKGEVGGPVETPEGYHLIYVQELLVDEKIPLEKVKKDLHKELFDEEVERAFQRYLDELKSKTFIEVRE